MRRAERGLGIAVRRGQESGEILRNGERKTVANQWTAAGVAHTSSKVASADVFEQNSYERRDAYAMADNASDEEFEETLASAIEAALKPAAEARKSPGTNQHMEVPGKLPAASHEPRPRGAAACSACPHFAHNCGQAAQNHHHLGHPRSA